MMHHTHELHANRVTELIRHLKNNFMVESTEVCRKTEKVLARTSKTLLPDSDVDAWKNHFERRKRNLHHGFFTPQHRPYNSVGDIALETADLVADVFRNHLPEKCKLPGIYQYPEVLDTPPPDLSQVPNDKPKDTKTDMRNPAVCSAGYFHIRQQLQELQDIVIAVKGGESFDRCVREHEESKRGFEEAIHSRLSTSSCRRLPPLSRHDRFSHYGIPGKQQLAIRSQLSMRLIQTPSPAGLADSAEDENDMIRISFYRHRKALLRKLESINCLLCCIYNIRTRDLKYRIPLTQEAVKSLMKKDIHLDHHGRPGIGRLVRHGNPSMETFHDSLSPHGNNLLPSSKGSKHSQHASGTSACGKAEHRIISPNIWKKFRSKAHKDRRGDMDTWEDLLNVGEKHIHVDKNAASGLSAMPRNSMAVNTGTLAKHVNAYSLVVSHYRSYRRHDQHYEKQPYWLGEGVTVPDKVKKTTTQKGTSDDPHKIVAEENELNLEHTVESLRIAFNAVQSKMTKDVLTDIERLERERCKTFAQKYVALKLSPLFEKEVKEMRKVSVQSTGQDLEYDIKPSKWYIDLKAESANLVGDLDKDINTIMKKLARFCYEDAKSIPAGKEKLCLLIMSLPADSLMTIHMQQGLRYVLNHILNAPTEFFNNWLLHRKVPVVI